MDEPRTAGAPGARRPVDDCSTGGGVFGGVEIYRSSVCDAGRGFSGIGATDGAKDHGAGGGGGGLFARENDSRASEEGEHT